MRLSLENFAAETDIYFIEERRSEFGVIASFVQRSRLLDNYSHSDVSYIWWWVEIDFKQRCALLLFPKERIGRLLALCAALVSLSLSLWRRWQRNATRQWQSSCGQNGGLHAHACWAWLNTSMFGILLVVLRGADSDTVQMCHSWVWILDSYYMWLKS